MKLMDGFRTEYKGRRMEVLAMTKERMATTEEPAHVAILFTQRAGEKKGMTTRMMFRARSVMDGREAT